MIQVGEVDGHETYISRYIQKRLGRGTAAGAIIIKKVGRGQ